MNGSRAANLVERIERARTNVASGEALSEHLKGLAELRIDCGWISKVSNRWPEVRVIQDVEHLCTELQFHRFVERDFAMYCEVPLEGTKPT